MPVNVYTIRMVVLDKQSAKLKKVLILISLTLFFFSNEFTNAQAFQIDRPSLPIDSLKKILPSLQGSDRVECLNEIARSYVETMQKKDADSALENAREAYIEASVANDIKGLGNACHMLGAISFWSWSFIESEKYYRQAISWYQKIPDHDGLGFAFEGVGASLFNQSSADEAMKAFEQAAFHFKKAGNQVMLADLTDWFSRIFELKGDFEKQFEYVKKGFREKKRINDKRGLVWSFYNLSMIYQSVEDYETGLYYLRESLRQAQSESVSWHPNRSLGNTFLSLKNYDSAFYYFRQMLQMNPVDGPSLAGIGKLFMLRKEYDKALDYLQQALIIYKKSTDTGRAISVLVSMAKTFTGTKQYTKALQCARKCLTMSRRGDDKSVTQSALEVHWKVYEDLKNRDSAYFYYKKFVTLKDSLENVKFKRQHLQKLTLYKAEIKEEQQQARINLLNKDNKIKHQQLQKEALMKKILGGILVFIVLLSIIILRNIALKRRNEKHRRELAENELQIQKLETERTKAELQQQATQLQMQALRAQMNPHFIFNSLNSINRFILKKQSREAAGYLTKFARLIRMILNNSANATVTLSEDLAALELYMELESLRFDQKFIYKVQIDPDVDANFIQIPPMLLQPFVENAIWHGLMLKKGEGHLWVNIIHEDLMLICTITDNGIGRE
ncbi:MAG TPA: histidine kinase, partial [Segetibacter sp.]